MNRVRVVTPLVVVTFLLVPVLVYANSGDFDGGVAIGSSYAGVDTAPTNGLIVQGDVGIGTTSPSYILSLGGTAAQTVWMERGTAVGNNLTVQAGGGVSGGSNENGGTLILSSGISTGTGTSGIDFDIYAAGSSGTTDNTPINVGVVTSNGLAIGTTSPLAVVSPGITLSSPDFPQYWWQATNGSANNHDWRLICRSSGQGDECNFEAISDNLSTEAPAWTVVRSGDSITYVYFPNGNVGIGTSSPAQALEVNGEVQVDSWAASSSTTVCKNGNVLSTCTSALRFKEHIEPSELGLKEALKMKPVIFDQRDHKNNWEKHDFGFIAEDMEKINPLFVTYDDAGTINGVRYMQLTAVNTKAIQELHATETEDVKALQAEIEKLKRTIEQLKQQQ